MVVAYLGVESSTPSLHPHIIGGSGVPAMLSSSQIRYPLDSSRETLRYLGAQVNSVILCVLLLYHCVLFYCIIVCALIVVKFTFYLFVIFLRKLSASEVNRRLEWVPIHHKNDRRRRYYRMLHVQERLVE